MQRNKVIKEGKLLQEQLQLAQQTAAKAASVAPKKTSLLVPGTIVGTGGLLASKEIADSVPVQMEEKPKRKLLPPPSTYKMHDPNSAEFVLGLGIAATIENSLATTIHGLRNAKLKKQIAQAQALTDNAKLAIEQANKSLPIKLGAIGVGTTALATPAFYYLNKQNQLKNNQRINPNENL